jgi:hypothetical protein
MWPSDPFHRVSNATAFSVLGLGPESISKAGELERARVTLSTVERLHQVGDDPLAETRSFAFP